MTLDKWMKKRGLTNEAMAEFLVEVRAEDDAPVHSGMVSRWRRGVVTPTLSYAVAIGRVTRGAVTPKDLLKVRRKGRVGDGHHR